MAIKGFVKFATRKLIAAVITILAIMCVNFALFRLLPGDPVRPSGKNSVQGMLEVRIICGGMII